MTILNKSISRLQFITNDDCKLSPIEQTELVCQGGIKWVQLRMKDTPEDILIETAFQIRNITKKNNARFIINDNPSIALASHADGVHLGSNDMLPKEAREMLGPNFIIGCTVNKIEDLDRLPFQEINYIGVGPYRYTSTKKDLSSILGKAGIQQIKLHLQYAGIDIPVIAIGGVGIEDLETLSNTGVYGVATSSAIISKTNVPVTAKKWVDEVEKYFKD